MRNFRILHRCLFNKATTSTSSLKIILPTIKPPGPQFSPLISVCYSQNALERYCAKTTADTILQQYATSESPQWEEITKKILSEESSCNETNIHYNILSSCLKQSLIDLGLSYVDYVFSKGKKLTVMEYYCLISLFSSHPDHIQKNIDLLKMVFNEVKGVFPQHFFAHKYVCKVYSQIKSCWKELVDICLKTSISSGSYVAAYAFEYDDEKTAWDLLYKHTDMYKPIIISSFFSYCVRLAKKGEFSPKLICNFVNFLTDNSYFVCHSDFEALMSNLITILNSDRNHKYTWSLMNSVIWCQNSQSKCLQCGHQLKKIMITDNEFNELKRHVYLNLMKNKTKNVATKKEEIMAFLEFLKKCSRYDVVFDGMNVVMTPTSQKFLTKLLKYFKGRKKEILFIGRKHLNQNNLISMVKANCQVFLSNWESDDDIYVIYATLYGGKETYFYSNDYYRGYCQFLETERLRQVFYKWQLSHHYRSPDRKNCIEPLYHGELPQMTQSPPDGKEGDYIWHLPISSTPKLKVTYSVPNTWLCLSAKIKKPEGNRTD